MISMEKSTINKFTTLVTSVLEDVAKRTNDQVEHIVVKDVYEQDCNNSYILGAALIEILEIDYTFKSKKWGYIELHDSRRVAVFASNEPEDYLVLQDYLDEEFSEDWEPELEKLLIEYHS